MYTTIQTDKVIVANMILTILNEWALAFEYTKRRGGKMRLNYTRQGRNQVHGIHLSSKEPVVGTILFI